MGTCLAMVTMVSVFRGSHQSKNSSKRAPDRQKTILFWAPFSEAMIFCVSWTEIMHVRPLGKSNPFSQNTYNTMFSCSGMGHNGLFFFHHVCVERLAPGSTEAKQKMGNERQLAFSCTLNIKTKSGNWAINMSRQPFQNQSTQKKIGLHKHRNNYFLLTWSNDMRAQHKPDKSNHSRWGSWCPDLGRLGAKSKKSKGRDHLFCVFSRSVLFCLAKILVANKSFVKHVCLTKRFVRQNGLFNSGEIETYMIPINNINGPNCWQARIYSTSGDNGQSVRVSYIRRVFFGKIGLSPCAGHFVW